MWTFLKIQILSITGRGTSAKEPTCQCNRRCRVQSLGWEAPLEESMATHSSILVWRISCSEEVGGLQSIGSQRVIHDWSNLATKPICPQSQHCLLSVLLLKPFSNSLLRLKKHLLLCERMCSHSVHFSRSVVSDSLRPHELQHARPPCPSPTPRVHSNSCPSSRWCHPVISSSVVPFSFCPQSLPASGSFPMCQLFASGGQNIGVSASASVPPMNTQDWSPLGWTGWTSLQSMGLSRVFSNTTLQKHQFVGAQLSSQYNFHIHTWPLEKPLDLELKTPLRNKLRGLESDTTEEHSRKEKKQKLTKHCRATMCSALLGH